MPVFIEMLMIVLILLDVVLLGVSRLGAFVRAVAVQGVVLGALTLVANSGNLTLRIAALAAVSMAVKGFLFPVMLERAMRGAGVRREIEPFVSFVTSMAACIVMLGVSLFLGWRLPLPDGGAGMPLVVPAAILTMLTGLFILVTRKKAVTQVVGYLTFENGIYAFGVVAVGEVNAIIEFGVLLDVFVAVFAMGIAIYQINREFDHIDTDHLSMLKG